MKTVKKSKKSKIKKLRKFFKSLTLSFSLPGFFKLEIVYERPEK